MSVKMLDSAPTVKYKRGGCFSVLKVPRDGISKVALLDASLPQGRPCMRLSLPSPSRSKCSQGLWGKLEWRKAEGRYSIPPPTKATAKAGRNKGSRASVNITHVPGRTAVTSAVKALPRLLLSLLCAWLCVILIRG